MRNNNSKKHLTLDDRIEIQKLLKEGENFTQIANSINKSRSTISREVIAHKYLSDSFVGNDCIHRNVCDLPSNCAHKANCNGNRSCRVRCKICREGCERYEKELCSMRDSSCRGAKGKAGIIAPPGPRPYYFPMATAFVYDLPQGFAKKQVLSFFFHQAQQQALWRVWATVLSLSKPCASTHRVVHMAALSISAFMKRRRRAARHFPKLWSIYQRAFIKSRI